MQKHFFDIGGNVGQTFDWLDTQDDNCSDNLMWIFEPSPRHFEKLIQKCKDKANTYKINLCPFGLGKETTTVKFFEKDDTMGDSFEEWTRSDHDVNNIHNGYTVIGSIVSLPEFILTNTAEDDKIFLDIDTEGSEYGMLESLLDNEEALKRVYKVIVEFHHISRPERFLSKEELVKRFSDKGIDIIHRGFA